MAAQILQIDLAQPLPTIRTLPRYRHLWILVRFGRQPLGWVRCRPRQFRRKIEPDPARPSVIRTVRGGGYLFSPTGEASPLD